MKKGMYKKSNAIMRFTAWVVIYAFLMLPSGVAFAGSAISKSLSQVPVPTPPNLSEFVKDPDAAIALGKALFWDMQVGSDGRTACATCHYRAGADPLNIRATNQLSPGFDGAFDSHILPNSPNQQLNPLATYFPFTQVTNPATADLTKGLSFTNDYNDVVGSQGVMSKTFKSITPGSAIDDGTLNPSPIFGSSRQVTGRNTPPAVNAIFNYANFWDGRANNIFNGNNPIGPLDVNSGIWVNVGPESEPVMGKVKIAIPNASLASQATGPALSSVEMSWGGRSWPEVGHKLLNNGLTPLGLQHVSKTDSVLGGNLANDVTGLNTTYVQMVKDAFQPKYWSLGLAVNLPTAANPSGENFTQMEANFSLFWGLAIQLYEATLVSDKTPMDLFLEGNNAAMTDTEKAGFSVFKSKCSMCHSGSELTDASVSNALANGLIEKGATNAGSNAISDVGFHNLGVRPTAEDKGRGGVINFDLSFSRQALDQANGTIPFAAPQGFPDGVTAASPAAVDGTFKTPQLRNVALNAPYMHDGSIATLADVVDFYARGGNFANAEQDKDMTAPLGINATDRTNLVAFLTTALTDPRVADESAPFDHPVLWIPDGLVSDGTITLPVTGNTITLAAKPTETATVVWKVDTTPPTVDISLVTAVTRDTTQTISGTVTAGSTVVVHVDTGAAAGPVTLAGSTWTCTVSGLKNGNNNITVTATDAAGNPASKTTTVKIVIADGCFRGTGSPDVTDALKALRMAVGIITPTVDDKMHGDVNMDNNIDSGDALLILKKATGLASF